jgi:Tol biopolymer transport system component/DNA-binding winged helix-turn-helix (wHTH) protein
VSEQRQNGIVSFGVFEADLRAGELRRSGSRVRLQDQPFQVLTLLLEKPGEVVTREELRSRLWPADTFVDFDHGLNAAIKRLRDALGDSAENPRFIETLARRGYRFLAPLNAGATPSTGAAAQERNPGAPIAEKRHSRWRIAVAAVAVLLMGSGAGWVAARRLNPKVQPLEQRLTANPPDDPVLNAVISPDGKYLAFADRSELFLRAVGTGETHSIALPEAFKAQPAGWFPDGSHLLVTKAAGEKEGASLWSVSVFGGGPRKLMDNAEARSVSPDGSQIAFVRGEVLHQEIWLMSADGELPHKVLGDLGDMFGSVVWSPDSRLLAFVRFNYRGGHKEEQASLWIVKPGGGLLSSILSDGRLGEALAWAPDGRLVYSLAERPPNQNDSNLWTINIEPRNARAAGQPVRITSGPDRKSRLSLSADGKHLTFLRSRGEAHVYVSEVEAGYSGLSPARPLSLDEGRNLPLAWTPDSKSVLFTSDREGPTHLFKQQLDQPAPDLLVGGSDSVFMGRLNPDGSQLIYMVGPSAGDSSGRARIMRMPLSGGTPQLLVQEPQISNFQCARLPSTTCIFSQAGTSNLSFTKLDADNGKEQPLRVLESDMGPAYNWTLSPDGSTLALAQWRRRQIPAEIQLVELKSGAARTLWLQDWAGITSIDWAADGRSLWVGALNPAGTRALLNVDLRGRARPLLQDAQKDIGWAIPSPDGRRIAYWETSGSSNAWLLQGF